MADSRTCRIAEPVLHPGGSAGRTGRKDQTMAKPRRPRWASTERVVKLLVGAVNALARLLDALHRIHQ
jgi:hypothetical protein